MELRAKIYYLSFGLLFLLLIGCKEKNQNFVPNIKWNRDLIHFNRLDSLLYVYKNSGQSNNSGDMQLNWLEKEQPFADFYLFDYLSLKNDSDLVSKNILLNKFVNDTFIGLLTDSVHNHFPDLSIYELEMSEAFSYAQYYNPQVSIPKIYTIVGALGPAAFTVDTSFLGINLDMYLGADQPFYSYAQYPKYASKRFEPAYITKNTMQVWLQNILPPASSNAKLIDEMAYQGRILYALDMLLPQVPDSIKIGYSEEQLAWSKKNEFEIWAYFLDRKLLYENDRNKYMKYVVDGPTTNGMPEDSPGNMGAWIGWQIVRQAMKNKKPEEWWSILQERNGQQWLQMAKYKPSKKA